LPVAYRAQRWHRVVAPSPVKRSPEIEKGESGALSLCLFV
jgi:hypothetical protein